ncbi:hypothetical protein GLE_4070 [Lysobacter enzymogenes]|uniref:Uncharacterized protein n=1 Tax=Lysobacter enzymogenes TaxID=69 RepID=A0A0S2DLP0_LYSEN|nr:hypothetical protein GLE_4070 [Lysobacter enzymogenes]
MGTHGSSGLIDRPGRSLDRGDLPQAARGGRGGSRAASASPAGGRDRTF